MQLVRSVNIACIWYPECVRDLCTEAVLSSCYSKATDVVFDLLVFFCMIMYHDID